MSLSRGDERKLHALSQGKCNLCSRSVFTCGTYVGENAI